MNTLNKIKSFGRLLVLNLIAILFILGLTTIVVGVFIGFGLVVGLVTSGFMLVIISLILVNEQSGRQSNR